MLNDALVEGMRIVGIDFRDGILFVPEVLLAANSMKGGMEILRPLLAETGVEPIGKMVIGTVKGDIHDIGKNLVAMMMEGAGFEVIDLGINNPVEKYLAALKEHKPDILGLSALLTTTMPYMKVVIDTMKDEGHPRRLHRAGRRSAAERGLRQGRGRGRLLPRRGDRRGNRQGADRRAGARRASRPDADGRRHVGTRLECSSSPAAPSPAKSRRCARRTTGRISTCAACPRNCTTARSAFPAPCATPSAANRDRYATIFVAYGDCGTGGALDAVLREENVERIPGAHCYEFFAGSETFAELADDEPGTFYLTDFLLRHFDRLVSAAWASIAIRSSPRSISATTAASSISRRSMRRSGSAAARAAGAAAGARRSRIASPATADWSAVSRDRSVERHARMAKLIVISWRDVPSQVVVKQGRDTVRVQLSARFQEAVDRAAMRAGKGKSDAYIADWKRGEPRDCGDDLKAEAIAEVARDRGAVFRCRPRAAHPRQRPCGARLAPAARTPAPPGQPEEPDARDAALVGAAFTRSRNLLSGVRARPGGARPRVAGAWAMRASSGRWPPWSAR